MQDLIRQYQETATALERRLQDLKQLLPKTKGALSLQLEKRIELMQEEYIHTCDMIQAMAALIRD